MPFLLGLLCVVALLFGACELWNDRALNQPPGVLVGEEPLQENLSEAVPFKHGEFSVRPLARFDARARVLSRELYRWDAGASLAPVDLALGWGPMSDSAVVEKLDLWQDGRWYQFRAKAYPLPVDQLLRHSSNMHMIPADRAIEKAMRSVRKGQIVHFRGALVEVSRQDGFVWRSSMTRNDTGSGACELVYVESFEVL